MTKTTIWYEFVDKEAVQVLRGAADCLEKTGYVKILLPNFDIENLSAMGDAQTPWIGCGGINPLEVILTHGGYWLDAIGALPSVKLLRNGIEPDHDYRLRLIARIRGEDLTPPASPPLLPTPQ